MGASIRHAVLGCMVALVACASHSEGRDADTGRQNGGATPIPFEGTYDAATGALTIRAPAQAGASGAVAPQSTLAYGTGAGNVYFHTCGVPTWTPGTHTLSATVQAVNLTGSTVSSFNSVIDSVSLAGVTPGSGTIAAYGTVASNTANCGSATATWSFVTPTDASFSFSGHADGSARLYFEDFNAITASGAGVQCTSGNTVYNSSTLTGWSASGVNAIHSELVATGNKAATFYDTNQITMTAGVAANQSGTTYTVKFLGGPSVWSSCTQSTAAGSGLVIDVLNPSNAVVGTYTYFPSAWAGSPTLTPASFTYTGNGTGVVRISIRDNTSDNRFGGAVDDLEIYGP